MQMVYDDPDNYYASGTGYNDPTPVGAQTMLPPAAVQAPATTGALSRLYDPTNASHADLLRQLALGLQGIIASGDNDAARRIYKEKQAQAGFTDEEFAPFTHDLGVAGPTGAPAAKVDEWKNGSGRTPGVDLPPAPVPAPAPMPVTPAPMPVTPAPLPPTPAPVAQTANPIITTDNRSTAGPITARDVSTQGAQSPAILGNQNVTGNAVTGSGNILGNNNVSGSYNTSNANTYQGWGTAGASAPPAFNTPVLDALYANQQQRMLSPAPTFNFQQKLKRGGPVRGALTRVIKNT